MSVETSTTAEDLRAWAKGIYPTEAAVEVLIRALDGRLLRGPWVVVGEHATYFDPQVAYETSGGLSGGERRVLDIAASLAGGSPVNLSDVLSGIDRASTDVICAAVSHAGGTHEHHGLDAVHPWPDA